jgi:hypothetical protein
MLKPLTYFSTDVAVGGRTVLLLEHSWAVGLSLPPLVAWKIKMVERTPFHMMVIKGPK